MHATIPTPFGPISLARSGGAGLEPLPSTTTPPRRVSRDRRLTVGEVSFRWACVAFVFGAIAAEVLAENPLTSPTGTGGVVHDDPEGGYRLQFPSPPQSVTTQTAIGPARRLISRDTHGHIYLAQVTPLGHRPASIELFFSGVRDAMARSMNLEVVHEEAMPLGPYPGRLILFRNETAGRTSELMIRKVYIDGHDYYLSVASVGQAGLDDAAARAFLSSLELSGRFPGRLADRNEPVTR